MQYQSKLSPRQSETVFDETLPAPSENLRDELAIPKARRRRKSARRRRWTVLLVTGASTLVSLFLLVTILSVRAEYGRWQTRVAQREGELSALQVQLKAGEHRLKTLQSPQGREELLIENG